MTTATTGDPLADAEALLHAGRLSEAARLFRGVLAQDATNVDALNGLATEALLRGSPAAARPLLARATQIEPGNHATYAGLAQVHALEGRSAEAEHCLATAVSLAPGRLEYRIAQAAAQAAKGEGQAALQALHALARQHPRDARPWQAIGALLLERGRPDGAQAALDLAVQADPGSSASYYLLGLAHARLGQAPQAIRHLQAALDLAPTSAPVLLALTELLLDQGNPAAAERLAREGALVAPGVPDLPCLQGRAMVAQGRTAEGMALLARTAQDAPQAPAPMLSLADAFLLSGEPAKAIAFVQAVQALPDMPASVLVAGAGLLLRAGQVGAGWAAMADTLQAVPNPLGTLRLRAPRSLADTLLFLRFVPAIAARGGNVCLSSAPALAPLLNGMPGLAFDDASPPDGDLLLLGPLAAQEPDGLPLLPLRPAQDQVAAWREAWAGHAGPVVAVAWGGGPGLARDDVLLALPPGALAVSVMTGSARAGLPADGSIRDGGAELAGYADMAALLAAADLVLLPDGPAAHLAGALGRPGVVHAPYGGHMAWAAPWYSSLTVLRRWDGMAARRTLSALSADVVAA